MLLADQVTAIDHVGVAVRDLDEAIAFYEQHIGFRLVHREVNVDQGVEEAMVQVGSADSCIQLLAPLDAQSTIASFLDRAGPGIQQLAYRVADLEAAMQAASDQGIRLLYESPRRGTAGSRVNFLHPKDVGGVLVELVEPKGGQA